MKRTLALLTSAVLAAAWPPRGSNAEDLGRLFFAPAQRQDLDRRRVANVQEAEVVTVESLITVNGFVSRSGGKNTTWTNGVPQDDSPQTGTDPSRVAIVPATGEPQVELKVGQTIDRTRGEIRDSLGDGEVRVGPGTRAAPRKPRAAPPSR